MCGEVCEHTRKGEKGKGGAREGQETARVQKKNVTKSRRRGGWEVDKNAVKELGEQSARHKYKTAKICTDPAFVYVYG